MRVVIGDVGRWGVGGTCGDGMNGENKTTTALCSSLGTFVPADQGKVIG